jgi:hypothetical protein
MGANPHYSFVAERAEYRCEYCRAPQVIFNTLFEVDHIVPSSKEGVDEPENWALACCGCNLHKSNALDAIDPLSQERVALFKPRTQRWIDHFEIDEASQASLRGKTPTGRATIQQLRLNHAFQRTARPHWIKLGLFP